MWYTSGEDESQKLWNFATKTRCCYMFMLIEISGCNSTVKEKNPADFLLGIEEHTYTGGVCELGTK